MVSSVLDRPWIVINAIWWINFYMLHPYLDAFYRNTQLCTSTGDFCKKLNGACLKSSGLDIMKFDVKDVRQIKKSRNRKKKKRKCTLVLLIVKLDSLARVLQNAKGRTSQQKWHLVPYTLTLICILLFFSVITAQKNNYNTRKVIRSSRSRISSITLVVPESPSRKFWLVGSGILGCGIRNPLMIQESGIQVSLAKNPEPSAWNLKSTEWFPKSKTVWARQDSIGSWARAGIA